ncbi:MAG: hypothetical protein ACOZNI_07715 [Myxococcota bacterium]
MLLLPAALAADPMLALDRHFEVDQGRACLTGVMHDVVSNWDTLTPAEQARAIDALSPFGDTLGPVQKHEGASLGEDSCVGQQMANRVTGTHFVVEWDDGATENTAESLLESLEHSYEVEIEESGWRAPDGDDTFLLPVYISDDNMGGAYTYVQSCRGQYLPYVVVGRDAATWGSWTETMAAHEFNHTLQFGYSYAPEFWWWEATATYIEEVVYPNYDWWADYVTGYADNPHIAMAASSQEDYDVFMHMYGMAIWGFYLAEYHGGQETVRATWEEARGGYEEYGAADMAEDLGLDLDTVYVDFITRNAAMEYADHRKFPDVDEVARIDELPASGEAERSTKPEGYGQNYIRIEAGAGEGDLVVTFEGDADVDWAVVLAEISNEAVLRSEWVRVEGGAGEITLEDIGEEDVMLIVSPLADGENKRDYSWTAEVKAAEEPVADEDPAGDPSGDEKVSLGGACGCASGGGAPMGLALLAAMAVRRRR